MTPLGADLPHVWQRLLNGDKGSPETISGPLSDDTFPVFRVPPEAISKALTHPRLRRSSAISRYAVVAGLAALAGAKVALSAESAARTAIIFAISNGGVLYTKRFYHDVVESGAQAASPLLFPETVFNAPASHLAAILGINGASYTLVGDGAIGILAIKMASDLMLDPTLDRCLVVGAEEADWLLCDAYRRWRLLSKEPPIRPFEKRNRGFIMSEGAGAILIDRAGPTILEKIDSGCNFHRQSEAAACVDEVFERLGGNDCDLVVASANGTFVDSAEQSAIRKHCPETRVYAPKAALGESVGAGAIWQVICAAMSLGTQELPPARNGRGERPSEPRVGDSKIRRAIVSSCGMNQQVAGLSLIRAE